jgi:molybdopterin molybdotransferase
LRFIGAGSAGQRFQGRGTTIIMLTVDEALAIVFQHAKVRQPEIAPLEAALGRVLAEDVASDLDMPPFDKAMMDGFAVRSADLSDGVATLDVVETVTAGCSPKMTLKSGMAARIMTGAPVPAGADGIVMVEQCETLDGGRRVRIPGSVRAGQHIQPRARELRCGEVVLRKGATLRPQEIGLLAMVGRATVRTTPPPDVSVLSTGDELVEPETFPGPGCIRNSNAPMLVAQAMRCGAITRNLGIARDTHEDLKRRISEGLSSPVLVLSGGVSAGKLDLVPGVLQELGVVAHFHKVAMKPGKPVFFGSRRNSDRETLVFGLPGNPVSAFVAFELFVRPAIRVLQGKKARPLEFTPCALADDFQYTSDRPTYHPAQMVDAQVRPVAWQGSPDLRALVLANALVLLPPGEHNHIAGAPLPVTVFPGN